MKWMIKTLVLLAMISAGPVLTQAQISAFRRTALRTTSSRVCADQRVACAQAPTICKTLEPITTARRFS